ncbi:hypothetical protein ACN8ZM_28520 [Burkholderia aenigmatica]|uniref:hypothetical protein n=1 Tax=Burkholderia aenigmatica TaxID=2015348 RepID=UPI003B4324C5
MMVAEMAAETGDIATLERTVVDINSGYMALAAHAEKLVRESVVPGGPITSIEMQTLEDGQLDLSLMQSML